MCVTGIAEDCWDNGINIGWLSHIFCHCSMSHVATEVSSSWLVAVFNIRTFVTY